MPIVLRVDSLHKRFGGLQLLANLSFDLCRGEVALLSGENGSGKTTLLNILSGHLEPDSGTIEFLANGTPREFTFPRAWWERLDPRDSFTPELAARQGIGRTWQDVRLFATQTLRENIMVAAPGQPGERPLLALVARGRTTAAEAALARMADATLERLGLAGRENASADMISLGQSKRVAIARAVAAGAKVLLLDEPLAGLDGAGINDVLSLLKRLVSEEHLTLVIVEHIFNQHHLDELVTTRWLLEKGVLFREQSSDAVQTRSMPIAPRAHTAMFSFSARSAGVRSRPTSRSTNWFDELASPSAAISHERLPRGAQLTRLRRADRVLAKAEPVLNVQGLHVRRGLRTVIGLDDAGQDVGFDLSLYDGEIAILHAPNGWGKSTLFAALLGLVVSSASAIELQGADVSHEPTWSRARRGLRLNAPGSAFFPSLRLSDLEGILGASPLMTTDLPGHRRLGSLSGGQMRRVALEAFLSHEGGVVALLDEPVLALDERASRQFAAQLLASSFSAILIAEPLRS